MRVWQKIRPSLLRRHVHERPYAALVLSGCYEEAGDTGRYRVGAGDVIFHEAFEAHLDRVPVSGAEVLNLPLAVHHRFSRCLGRTLDVDAIVTLAEKDQREASALLLSSIQVQEPQYHDWPDQLAAALIRDASLNLSSWSEATGISAWTLSRGFAKVFGISPSAFRARARARQAWRAIRSTDTALVEIAAQCGFADQAHMTRTVKGMTDKCPSAWREGCK
jgi:AraC-like DNA-binding protein